ncbi:cupin domain-containing protein [Hymenobacter canadensis]|uniref:Cupin domain-containing protein n=1 Tax=Hymenobacter canadensis TaxID=2999067 RepID=A0ABY7LVR9_9BACT|nr:cupin domain-containing protein [Hymenobacter canadensis]WBA42825.1 cupin domain-containing protein [Hymenobacter canadensis]
MLRRSFLHLSLAAPGLAVVSSFVAPSQGPAAPPRRSLLVRAGTDSTSRPFKFLDALFTVKVSGRDTQGRCVIFDTLRPAKVGPQLHLHTDLDEWFYVEAGEFKFQAGEETMRLKAGDSLFVPRNMPHAFVKTSEGTAHLIVMHQPAGTMEEYFRTASAMPDQSPEARRALGEKHGMRFLGPALTPD